MSSLWDQINHTDGDVRAQTFVDEDLSCLDVGHVEFEDCSFEGCSFAECVIARASFERCTFVSCDFSNARLPISYWRDCTMRASRLVGCDLHHSYMMRTRLTDCAGSYANLAESKLESVTFHGCDLREASLSQLKLKRLTLASCDLTRAEFFSTRLRGVDLSSCTITALRVSDTFAELRGAKIGLDQAPDLVGLLGVTLL